MGKARALKITACYIVKNEAENLAKSIKSLKTQVNEIVVVDTGSTDNTMAVARKLGAKVYSFPWQDDFSKARNFALSKAKGDWLILLDADEYFTAKTAGNIRQVIRQAQQADGLLIQMVNYDVDKAEIQDYFYQLRIVRNQQGLHYEGKIHEELKLSEGKSMKFLRIPPEMLEIYHTGYASSVSRQKLERNLKLLQQAVDNGQSEADLARYFCDCYLGLGDMEKCTYYGWLNVKQGRRSVNFGSRCHRVLMAYYGGRNDVESIFKRRQLAEISVEQYPEVPDFWAEYSECLYQVGEYAQAIAAMEKALELMQDYHGMEPSMLVEEHMESQLEDRLQVFRHTQANLINQEKSTIKPTDDKCNGGIQMARLKNKINKNKMKKRNNQAKQVLISLKHDMQQFMEAENYTAAMDVMAEMAANMQMDGEIMYWGAQCYFFTGDFERAEKWVNNALNNSYNSAGLKMLLATLCMADERNEDAFKLCEAVLTEGIEAMSKQELEIFDNFMDNITYGYDELVSEYPKISEYLQKKQADNEANSPVSKLKEILKGKKIEEAKPQQVDIQEEVKTEQEEAPSEDKAQAALARLRQLLSKNKEQGVEENNEVQKPVETTIISEAVQEKDEITPEIQRVEKSQPIGEESDNIQQNEVEKVDVSDTLAKIVAKEISLVEKVRLLNVFAGVCYQQGDYQSAFDLLSAALEIDGQDAATLKNIAYTCLSTGEQEQAISFAAKLPVVDFALLYALKK
ncbi:MAG: tetratricopeptide repeat protein [Veillonellaceae bacterium]|nr:tetratricopeptide repeat protein [Veillonellaceae bacterium]